MSNINVQQRKFIVKAGMTVDDVKNSKEATAMQKKYASDFDTDGQKGFSQKEADLFNATTFSEKSALKQNESVSFFDEKWSGHQIAKLTGDNVVTDWLQNKDKVCTDGKDDGKLSAGQYALSFSKGLIGGIPKAIINHPITTAVAVVTGVAAVALTGGAILPVLGAAGVVTGVGMVGYGGYKAATAKTDGEAKQALETMGMGVTTTALSVAAADKALEKAAEAGVKSAQVPEDAGILDKTVQMFKAIPECLTKSKEWARFKLDIPVTKIRNDKGLIVEKRYGNDTYKQYKGKYCFNYNTEQSDYGLSYEKLPNGTTRTYDHKLSTSHLLKEEYTNGAYKIYDRYINGRLLEEKTADGAIRKYSEYSSNELLEETYTDGGYKIFDRKGNITEELRINGDKQSYYENGKLIKETYTDGGYKIFDKKGNVVKELVVNGEQQSYYENGELVKEIFADGGYKKYNKGIIIKQKTGEEVAKDLELAKAAAKNARKTRAYASSLSSSSSSSSSESLPNGATPSMYIKDLLTGEVTPSYDVEDCPSYTTRQLYESFGYHFVHR